MPQLLSDGLNLTVRKKLILAGLYLSKFNSAGLKELGFDSFTEAFNVIGYALGSRPASVKNYRDEFDPLFPNKRRGWHKRPMRQYCEDVYAEYQRLDIEGFSGLIRTFFGSAADSVIPMRLVGETDDGTTVFAQRLVTGLAAERYFESRYSTIPIFQDFELENTTAFGCGYDFRLHPKSTHGDFIAVEVKGLKDQGGGIALTPKEYEIAAAITDRYFLFVVRNFRENPNHLIFRDPVNGGLEFRKTERIIVQVSWLTSV